MSDDRRSKRQRASALALLCACMAGVPLARAGTSGSVALTSDYVFRGVSQSNRQPALQAGIEYAADSGVYAGSWGSSISWLSDLSAAGIPVSSNVELDFYGGYRGTFSDAVGFDVGALYYWYPGDYPAGFNSADTTELYAGISVAPSESSTLGLKYSHAVTDLFGYTDSSGSGYLDASANVGFGTGWTLNLHAGRQWIANNDAYAYSDWKVGVTKAFDRGFAVAVAWTDTDADRTAYTNPSGRVIAAGTVAVTASKAF